MYLFDMRIMDICHDNISSNLLTVIFRASYVRYIRVDKKIIKRKDSLLRHIDMSKKGQSREVYGTTHVIGPSVHDSSAEDTLIRIWVFHVVVKTDHNPVPVHANAFHSYRKAFFDDLHVCH